MQIRDLGEFPFIRRLRGRVAADPRVALGMGDDCAALSLPGTTLLTTDTLVENVHFRRQWTSFASLGAKAFAVNASDIIAMGGEPTFALLSLSTPQDDRVEDLDAFFDGFLAAAGERQVALIGGNMSAGPCLTVSVTLLGRAPHGIVTRSGARVGDDVYVTGSLGDAALGLRLFQEGRDDAVAQGPKARFVCPQPRFEVARAMTAQRLVSAMLDVSDGLLQDLGHLCEESRVGARIEASRLPVSDAYRSLLGPRAWDLALTGGEDYELLFCASPVQRDALRAVAETCGCAVTRIGTIVPERDGSRVFDAAGEPYLPTQVGHDHFRRA